jgi:hypothetical protein
MTRIREEGPPTKRHEWNTKSKACFALVLVRADSWATPSRVFALIRVIRVNPRPTLFFVAHFGAGHFKCSWRNAKVPTPWIVWGPSKNSIVVRSGIFRSA